LSRTTRLDGVGQHSAAIQRGWTAPAGADEGPTYVDLQNNSGVNLVEGDVVVVTSDGTIAPTTTAADPRPTGVCIDDIDTGDSGPVQFFGPVDYVNVTASVTAGQYGATSTTTKKATASAATTGSFVYFTTSGTSPEGFLWQGLGGGSGGTGTDAAEPVFDHGNMGATETLDLADGTWHRGTLDANCTITVTGFTVDEGLVVVFEVTQNGTGGWDITWDADVEFIGTDQPDQTAGSVTVFLLFSSAGDSTIYGAKVGSGATSPLTTKGDLWGYDTADARIPVGTNGYLLVADSTDAQGIVWENPETTGHWEVLMTGASPAEPLEDGSGTDWLYTWVS
jgi:hypothetical protein